MRWPRRGILIRLAIYVPLLAFFGWRALLHWQAEQEAKRAAEEQELRADPLENLPQKTIEVGGRPVQVYEITPAQAEAYFGVEAEAAEGTTGG